MKRTVYRYEVEQRFEHVFAVVRISPKGRKKWITSCFTKEQAENVRDLLSGWASKDATKRR